MKIFVESGAKRVFAGAVDWPGLARSGKTVNEALAALVEYIPRYRQSLGSAARSLKPVSDAAALDVVQQLKGGSGTDFGVPSSIADFDTAVLTDAGLDAQVKLLRAAWKGFEQAAARASGTTLTKGPRGGGRSVELMREHVAAADIAYISSLGAKPPRDHATWDAIQDAFVEALHAKLRGELPAIGPRGGARWPARYAIRRSAWHALDHAWEIEDRS